MIATVRFFIASPYFFLLFIVDESDRITVVEPLARRNFTNIRGIWQPHVGNSLHLTMEMFKRAAGIDIQAIPYRGDAPLNTALIANEVDVAIVPLVAILPHVQSGAIRALAVNSAQRSALLPEVPTLSEDAVPGFEVSGWQGWFVPAKTPPDVVAAIHRETAKIIADPAVAKRLLAMGNEPVGSTPDAFAAKFRDDVARFAKVIKDAGIPLQ